MAFAALSRGLRPGRFLRSSSLGRFARTPAWWRAQFGCAPQLWAGLPSVPEDREKLPSGSIAVCWTAFGLYRPLRYPALLGSKFHADSEAETIWNSSSRPEVQEGSFRPRGGGIRGEASVPRVNYSSLAIFAGARSVTAGSMQAKQRSRTRPISTCCVMDQGGANLNKSSTFQCLRFWKNRREPFPPERLFRAHHASDSSVACIVFLFPVLGC